MMSQFKLLTIGGVTGTGKSNLAYIMAKRLNGELVNCDRVQLSKGLAVLKNLDTRKTDTVQHLYEEFANDKKIDASEYSKFAREKILDIQARGKVPIIEGGSSFYLKHLLQGNTQEDNNEHGSDDVGSKF